MNISIAIGAVFCRSLSSAALMVDWPMELMTRTTLDQYLGSDRILERIASLSTPGDENLTCQKWLLTTPAKRMIFDRLYGDLIDGNVTLKRRILDVGGGLTSFTRHLAKMQKLRSRRSDRA